MTTADTNPHDFTEETLEHLAETSGQMYDIFYDFLATYQFDFTLEERNWCLDKIRDDILKANTEADQN